MHRVLVDAIPAHPGELVEITGDEARHALRVKRLREGEPVELLDGRGSIASAVVVPSGRERDPVLKVRVETIRRLDPTRPRVEVCSAVPKGDRAAEMIDQLAQTGAASWSPLETARGIVDPRGGGAKLDRLERIAREASKQCGRAWTMEVGQKRTLADALRPDPTVRAVIAHITGRPWNPAAAAPAQTIRLLIGPEGDWTDDELTQARTANAIPATFGPHVMRVGTAAVVACAILLKS